MSLEFPPVPRGDTIARFCKAQFICNGVIQPTAFQLRLTQGKREEYLSVNSLEMLHAERPEAIKKFKELCVTKRLPVKGGSGIATMNVGSLIKNVEDKLNIELLILNKLKPAEPSYSGIYGYPLDQDMVSELILEVVQDITFFSV